MIMRKGTMKRERNCSISMLGLLWGMVGTGYLMRMKKNLSRSHLNSKKATSRNQVETNPSAHHPKLKSPKTLKIQKRQKAYPAKSKNKAVLSSKESALIQRIKIPRYK